MNNNFDLKKLYDAFIKALDNLKDAMSDSKPRSIVSQAGTVGLFEFCCDRSYVFMKNFLEYQGFFIPVTASPEMIMKNAFDCGIIGNRMLWEELLNTRNILSHTYDEKKALESINGILDKYIPVFEELKQNIDENWLI